MMISGTSLAASTKLFQNSYARNSERVNSALEQLSTGKRINRPSDDPSGFVAAEEIRGELIDLHSADKIDASRRIQISFQESALSNIQGVLIDVRGELVTAADGALNTRQRKDIQNGIDSSLDAIDLIAGRVEGVAGSEKLEPLRRTAKSVSL